MLNSVREGDKLKPRLGPKPASVKNAREVHTVLSVKKLIAGETDADGYFMTQQDVDGDGGYWIMTDKLDEWHALSLFRSTV